jgi:two-component system, chemotaxis family, sensor kinase CheA
MDEFEKELKLSFLQEANQHLQDTEQCFLDLEKKSNDPELIEKIFRFAHNLKGSAKAVGFSDMGEFMHEMESLLIKIKKGEILVKASTVSLLLLCNDHLRLWVQALSKNLEAKVDFQNLLMNLQSHSENIEAQDDEFLSQLSVNFIDVSVADSEETNSIADESIRVALPRLEKLMNNVGELVILQTVLNQHKSEIESSLLQKTITQLAKITKDIQDISMSLRMLPLKQTFQKMQRIVRDTAQELDKEIQLVLEGEETELDKTVIEHLSDPLVHLIRNAVDHGIEIPEEREAAGKSRKGRIYLRAFHSAGKIIIQVRDDGKGLDPNILKQKAIEKSLISEQMNMSEIEAQNLIFFPGFSTKKQATEISGRGIGMDVVKTNIEKILHGEISLQSQPGMGTLFTIQLPLTLAIVEGMIVSSKNEKYIVPLAQIHESVRLNESIVHKTAGLGTILTLRDEEIPLFHINELLFHRGNREARSLQNSIAIIIRSGATPFAVAVDDILGQHQVVIKSLGKEMRSMRGLAGGAILGDGKAALILDLQELIFKNKKSDRDIIPLRSVV